MKGQELNKEFDIIIAGGGASGLSLAIHLLTFLPQKKVLILEKEDKNVNDRTWCFWTKDSILFDNIVFRRWDQIRFKNKTKTLDIDIHPYQYQMIRGIDFYQYAHKKISESQNYHIVREELVNYQSYKDYVEVKTKKNAYTSTYFFNSIPPKMPSVISKKNNFLLQHFLGFIIRTEKDSFDPDRPYFMDFSVEQKGEARFGYVLPFSKKEALVEFTLFSEKLLDKQEYPILLKNYIHQHLGITQYKVTEEEFGVIPMTDLNFSRREAKNVFNIGYRSGMTKGSSGYTFLNIQKDCRSIVNSLKRGNEVSTFKRKMRYQYYDSILLHVLAHNLHPADQVFSDLFMNNEVKRIFKFLDEESSLTEDLKIISSLSTLPFIKGALQRFFYRGTKITSGITDKTGEDKG